MNRETVSPREATLGEDQIFREKNKSLGYLRYEISLRLSICIAKSILKLSIEFVNHRNLP